MRCTQADTVFGRYEVEPDPKEKVLTFKFRGPNASDGTSMITSFDVAFETSTHTPQINRGDAARFQNNPEAQEAVILLKEWQVCVCDCVTV